jgi:hypothetical protein
MVRQLLASPCRAALLKQLLVDLEMIAKHIVRGFEGTIGLARLSLAYLLADVMDAIAAHPAVAMKRLAKLKGRGDPLVADVNTQLTSAFKTGFEPGQTVADVS